jgi:hypothetical protein
VRDIWTVKRLECQRPVAVLTLGTSQELESSLETLFHPVSFVEDGSESTRSALALLADVIPPS